MPNFTRLLQLRRRPSAWKPSRISLRLRVAGERVLDLGERRSCACSRRLAPSDCSSAAVPERADHLGAGVRAARVADARAVAHLGERGAQVVDVRRLVGADVAHERGGLAVAGDEVGVGRARASAQANVWNAETSMNSSPIMRRSIISSVRSRSREPAHRFGGLAHRFRSRRLARARPMPMRASIVCVSSSVTGARTRCRARRTTSACGRLRPPSRLRRGRGPRTARGRGAAIAVPSMRLVEDALHVAGLDVRGSSRRSPRPCRCGSASRSSARARPRASRYRACATFGKGSGHISSGASRISVPNCSRCAAATPRSRARGASCAARRSAVGVEAAVAAHAARDQRLGDRIGREQLLLAPGQLQICHRRQCKL